VSHVRLPHLRGVRRWRFEPMAADERAASEAVRSAAARIRSEHPELPATAIAVRAVEDR